MRGRAAALLMTALLVLYLVLVGQRAVLLMASGVPVGIVMGVALILFPIIAALLVGREIQFGLRTQNIVRLMAAEGSLPVETLPTKASGRPDRQAADAEFPAYQAAVERDSTDWRAWFRLGLAYDASGDRRRARQAMREAIRVRRTGTGTDTSA